MLARNELMSEIPMVNRMLVNIQAALHLKRMLDQADLHITPSRLVMFSFMAGMLGALAASVLTVVHPDHYGRCRTRVLRRSRSSTFGGNARSASTRFWNICRMRLI